ncbi:MAG: tetratricopeptide repeat protein [Clostridia bacterium]|nr:tetratricopeptide repeat protein [Clostridia bacterium]
MSKNNSKVSSNLTKKSAKDAITESNSIPHSIPRKTGLLCILIILVSITILSVHWPALSSKAISFDDHQYLIENQLVKNPSWSSASRFLTEVLRPSTVSGYYQPFSMISLMLDYKMAGSIDNLMPFHRTSLILHVLNTALIIVILYILFRRPWVSSALGLIFGLHPMTVETIAWVGERKTTLAAFFALLSILAYIIYCKRSDKKFYYAALAMYVFSLLSKPTSTTLPIALLLIDFWPLYRLNLNIKDKKILKEFKKVLIEKIPFIVICMVSAVITYISQKETASVLTPDALNVLRIPLILCHNIIFYIYKMLLPFNLTSHYPMPDPLTITHPAVLGGVIGTILLTALLMFSLRWTRAVFTGFSIFFIVILPTMQIIGFTIVLTSDKYAYLPAIGFLMILAWLLTHLDDKIAALSRRALPYAGIALIILCLLVFESTLTLNYLVYWKDTETLYKYMISLAPTKNMLYYNLGTTLEANDKIDEAALNYKESIRLDPNYSSAYINLGNILLKKNMLDEAMKNYRQAISIISGNKSTSFKSASTLPGIYYNMGILLAKKGDLDGAISNYNECIKLDPNYPDVYISLGNALILQKKYAEAEKVLKKVGSIKQDSAEAFISLGNSLANQGKLDEAINTFNQAIAVDSGNFKAFNNIGVLLYRQKKYDEAADYFTKAIKANPLFEDANNNLVGVLQTQGKIDEAISHLTEFVRISPDSEISHKNLSILLTKQGRLEEAAKECNEVLRINPDNQDAKARLAEIRGKLR